MKPSCQLAAQVLEMISEYVRPGVSTLELDERCHKYMVEHGAIPAPLNYRGFPKSICTSVNDVVCHGIPKKEDVLKKGDIVNLDITTILHGYHGDTSKMFKVGEITKAASKLIDVAHECLMRGIATVHKGSRIGDIGAAIEAHATAHNYSVVKEFVGHGIGKKFHEDPQVPHYGKAGTGPRLEEGMVFTIEPMINEGHWKTKVRRDKWTAVTIDGSLSAQFEHTIAIRSSGEVEILTQL